jgi:hypothetical protein
MLVKLPQCLPGERYDDWTRANSGRPNTATDAQTPPQQRLLALSGVVFVPFFVVAGVGALVAVAP